MVIPMLAMAATAVVLIPILLLLLRFTKSNVIRFAGAVVCCMASFPVANFFFKFLLALTVEYGVDVDPNEVPGFDIPADATEISFYKNLGPTRLIAQFTITEDGFRNWMEQNSWTIEPITDSENVVQLSSAVPPERTVVEIKSGFRWDDYDKTVEFDDSGTTIVFDDMQNRVYIRVSLW